MNIIKTNIDGVLIIEPRLFRDARGYFFESFSEREFDEKVAPILGHSVHFCQDNESMSSYGVMRGLHIQRPPHTKAKRIARCAWINMRRLFLYDLEMGLQMVTKIVQRPNRPTLGLFLGNKRYFDAV